jgi:hypothetical protein
MDPIIDRKTDGKVVTLGELISYYYDKFSEIYESPELRNLAVTTVIDDILSRAQDEE